MAELILYFEMTSGEDKFYVTANFGEQKKDIDYMKVAESVNKSKLLENLGLDSLVIPENVRAITKEEYERNADNG